MEKHQHIFRNRTKIFHFKAEIYAKGVIIEQYS